MPSSQGSSSDRGDLMTMWKFTTQIASSFTPRNDTLHMSFVTNKKALRVMGVLLVLLVAAGLVGVGYWWPHKSAVVATEPTPSAPVSAPDYSLAHGGQLVALLIDGFVAAKPQSGLDMAPLVFEFPAEAAIPRYLAFFNVNAKLDDDISFGPIRSLRPYFLDVADGFGATVAHVGGSPAALEQVKKYHAPNLNQFFQSQYFYRSLKNEAPHNVYTTTALLNKAFLDGTIIGYMDPATYEPRWS